MLKIKIFAYSLQNFNLHYTYIFLELTYLFQGVLNEVGTNFDFNFFIRKAVAYSCSEPSLGLSHWMFLVEWTLLKLDKPIRGVTIRLGCIQRSSMHLFNWQYQLAIASAESKAKTLIGSDSIAESKLLSLKSGLLVVVFYRILNTYNSVPPSPFLLRFTRQSKRPLPYVTYQPFAGTALLPDAYSRGMELTLQFGAIQR